MFLSNLFKPDIEKLKLNSDILGLLKALEHRKQIIRSEAQNALLYLLPSIMNDKAGITLLVSALGHSNPLVYKTISEMLFNNISLLSSCLLEALSNPLPQIKWRSTEIAGRLKFEAATDIICQNLLSDQNGNVKESSIWALEQIGNSKALNCIEESKNMEVYKHHNAFKGSVVTGGLHSAFNKKDIIETVKEKEIEEIADDLETKFFKLVTISKDEILKQDVVFIREMIDKKVQQFIRLDSKINHLDEDEKVKTCVDLSKKMMLVKYSISGYDEDPRNLWDFKEVHDWSWNWIKKQPYCFLFLDNESYSLLTLCCLGAKKIINSSKYEANFQSPQVKEYASILRSSFQSTISMFGNHFVLGAFALSRNIDLTAQYEKIR